MFTSWYALRWLPISKTSACRAFVCMNGYVALAVRECVSPVWTCMHAHTLRATSCMSVYQWRSVPICFSWPWPYFFTSYWMTLIHVLFTQFNVTLIDLGYYMILTFFPYPSCGFYSLAYVESLQHWCTQVERQIWGVTTPCTVLPASSWYRVWSLVQQLQTRVSIGPIQVCLSPFCCVCFCLRKRFSTESGEWIHPGSHVSRVHSHNRNVVFLLFPSLVDINAQHISCMWLGKNNFPSQATTHSLHRCHHISLLLLFYFGRN
jgi:hypothetical protein